MAAPMESEFLIQQQNALKFNGKQRSNCVFESTKTFSKDDQMFTVTIHDPQTCREFMVTHRKFSFRRWLQQTAVVNVFAFGFGFHKMVSGYKYKKKQIKFSHMTLRVGEFTPITFHFWVFILMSLILLILGQLLSICTGACSSRSVNVKAAFKSNAR